MATDTSATYFLVGLGDAEKGEIRSLNGNNKLDNLSAAISNVSWIESGEELHFIVRFQNGRSELWRGSKSPRKLLDLGLGYAGPLLLDSDSELVIRYEGGRADVVDLNWLNGMGLHDLQESASVIPLSKLLCDGVLGGPWLQRALSNPGSVSAFATAPSCP